MKLNVCIFHLIQFMLLNAKSNMANSEIVKEVPEEQLPKTSLNPIVPSDLQSGFC